MKGFVRFTGKHGDKRTELQYSIAHFISGNHRWFCRFHKEVGFSTRCGWAYGKNKFQAYRLALKDLNREIEKYEQ